MAGAVPLTSRDSRLRLQPLVRANVASLGDAGRDWLTALPGVLADLERRWRLTLGRPLPGGSHSYVVAARTVAGEDVVVKVSLQADGFDDQVRLLQQADGRGYVRMLEFDKVRQALLLEALGPALEQSGLAPEDQLRQLVRTLRVAWQPPAPDQQPLDKAGGLASLVTELYERLGRPCSQRVIDQALAYAEQLRDLDPAELVVVHGDPHPGNALRVPRPRPGGETGYCFVDPDGFVADRAYDLGVTLRDWSGRLVDTEATAIAQRYSRLLAEESGVDEQRIWRWGYLERVSTGLYVMSFGSAGSVRLGRTFLDAAERLVALR